MFFLNLSLYFRILMLILKINSQMRIGRNPATLPTRFYNTPATVMLMVMMILPSKINAANVYIRGGVLDQWKLAAAWWVTFNVFFFFSATSKSFKPCIFHLRFVVSNGHDANRLCTFLCCSTGFTYIRFTFTRTLSLLYCIWVTKAWNCHISKKYRYRLYAFVNYLDRLSEYARVYFLIRRHMNKF